MYQKREENASILLPGGVRVFMKKGVELSELETAAINEAVRAVSKFAPVRYVNMNTDRDDENRLHNISFTFARNNSALRKIA